MPAQLNHIIVWCSEPDRSARFLATLLDRAPPVRFGMFHLVTLDNGVSLDFGRHEGSGPILSQHYAFLVDEADFDRVFGRLREQGLDYWADPARRQRGQINRADGGRGVYFADPDGHLLEVITRPYGGT